MAEDADFCILLKKAIDEVKVKIKPMQTGQKNGDKPSSHFVEILSSLKADPYKYLRPQNPKTKFILLDGGIKDDDDQQIWDWYVMYCPTGPPCDFLKTARRT